MLRKRSLFWVAWFVIAALPAFPANGPDTVPGSAVILRDNFFPVQPVEGLVGNETAMRAGLLFDCISGEIVWEKDMHYAYPIASLTKMMVALLTVEDVLNCRADWSDEVVMTRRLVKRVKRRRMTYTVHETYTLDGLLHMALIPSHNEACNTIARYLGGTVDDFVARMNKRARELNMNNTFYSNPSGLPASRDNLDNSSSPADLLLLSLECLKYPEIINITRIGYAEVENDKSKSVFRNHNRLVIDYENEVDGLKTGFTRNARYCLAATSGKGNHRLVSIVLGCRSTWERNAVVAGMLSNYYQRIGLGTLGKTTATPPALLAAGSDPAGKPVGTSSTLPGYTYKWVWTTEKSVHRVRSGESLSTIAQRYHCSVQSLRKWNRLRSSRIYAGAGLVYYKNVRKKVAIRDEEIDRGDSEEESPSGEAVADAGETTTRPETSEKSRETDGQSVKAAYIYHTVQPGDTLWNIAKQYEGVTVEQLKRINRIQNTRSLKPGMRIKIRIDS